MFLIGKFMKYVANPVIVDAYKIISIHPMNKDDKHKNLTLDNDTVVMATPEMLARIDLEIGDYWIIQSDGYIYLNPKEVFEKKYSPLV
jgi:hypothetical protein